MSVAPEEVENEFEVAYDEEYDPQREEELKTVLENQQGSLSAYWARIIYISGNYL